MKILITGSPGSGKSTIAKALGKKLEYSVINEREFAVKRGIGALDKKSKEWVIPLKEIEIKLNKLLNEISARKENVIVEGHVLCEAKLDVDLVIVLQASAKTLQKRMKKRNYADEKIFDNLFCAETDFFRKQAIKNYGKKKVKEVSNEKDLKQTLVNIVTSSTP